jgi:predicted MarR family transcription regulator
MKPVSKAKPEHAPIVSSAHLVSAHSAEMSEFEFGLIVAGNAFHRWVVHCMAAAGLKELTPLDVLCCTTSRTAPATSAWPTSASS